METGKDVVVFIKDRTATHPEARFDRVKDCLRTGLNGHVVVKTVQKRPRTALERVETYWERV